MSAYIDNHPTKTNLHSPQEAIVGASWAEHGAGVPVGLVSENAPIVVRWEVSENEDVKNNAGTQS